ncbi:MAG: hypothetical protein NVS3B12_10080 [Acidimicrobiales bacterium]
MSEWREPPRQPEEVIDCIDCGGRCHLLTTWPADDPPQAGDIVVYRCSDCLDSWHLVVPEDDGY